jgi:hypothetical protein
MPRPDGRLRRREGRPPAHRPGAVVSLPSGLLSACRSCGAEIVWAITGSGKRMPVDADPTPDGNLILTDDPPHAVMLVQGQDSLFAAGAGGDSPRYTSHFATCEFADQHRRTR